jgi:uncharacterized protein (DUF302 family)
MNESDAGYAERKSSMAFQQTVDRLADSIEKAGMTVFARIDHAAGARELGMSMAPAVVLIYGHARGGTPVMLFAPAAALDLPLRVLIRENDKGETLVAYHPIQRVLETCNIPDKLTVGLAKAQQIVVGSI